MQQDYPGLYSDQIQVEIPKIVTVQSGEVHQNRQEDKQILPERFPNGVEIGDEFQFIEQIQQRLEEECKSRGLQLDVHYEIVMDSSEQQSRVLLKCKFCTASIGLVRINTKLVVFLVESIHNHDCAIGQQLRNQLQKIQPKAQKVAQPIKTDSFTCIFPGGFDQGDIFTSFKQLQIKLEAEAQSKGMRKIRQFFKIKYHPSKSSCSYIYLKCKKCNAQLSLTAKKQYCVVRHTNLIHNHPIVSKRSIMRENIVSYLTDNIDRVNEIKVEVLRQVCEVEGNQFKQVKQQFITEKLDNYLTLNRMLQQSGWRMLEYRKQDMDMGDFPQVMVFSCEKFMQNYEMYGDCLSFDTSGQIIQIKNQQSYQVGLFVMYDFHLRTRLSAIAVFENSSTQCLFQVFNLFFQLVRGSGNPQSIITQLSKQLDETMELLRFHKLFTGNHIIDPSEHIQLLKRQQSNVQNAQLYGAFKQIFAQRNLLRLRNKLNQLKQIGGVTDCPLYNIISEHSQRMLLPLMAPRFVGIDILNRRRPIDTLKKIFRKPVNICKFMGKMIGWKGFAYTKGLQTCRRFEQPAEVIFKDPKLEAVRSSLKDKCRIKIFVNNNAKQMVLFEIYLKIQLNT